VTIEQVTEEENEPTSVEEVPPSKARFRRRCSVTKYSLDCAQQIATSFKVTVEEPIDTVDSIEHRSMLANDTIESHGAGDLIVGWGNASADFIDEHADDGDLLCGFGTRANQISLPDVWQTKEYEKPTGSYVLNVLRKTFSRNPWITTLHTEISVENSGVDDRASIARSA